MNAVPHASVVVKWYIPERDHEPARDLRDDYLDGSHDLFAPALLPFEAINVLRYSGYYEGDRLAEAAVSLSGYGIELRPFSGSGSVATVAESLDVTVYDASYVALAAALDGLPTRQMRHSCLRLPARISKTPSPTSPTTANGIESTNAVEVNTVSSNPWNGRLPALGMKAIVSR